MTTITKPAQTTFLGNLGNAIATFWRHDVAPVLVLLWNRIQMDVIQQLLPVAHAELDKLDQALFTSGTEGFLKAFNATMPAVLQHAESSVEGSTIHDVITTLQGAIAQRQSAATGT